jgi:MoaA/NifB/PqqE/SkfB family radical SAM enzyme
VRTITLGFACNNACLFCAQGELRAQVPARAREDVERAIAAVVPGEVVGFVGGEPTLFADLPAWIHQAAGRGASSVVVQTNGRRLAYRAYARELAAASRLVRLDVALQGSTPAMHDWHTGTPESFAQTVRGLRHAQAEGIRAGVTTVVTRANYRHLGEIVRVARAAGASAVHFAPVEAEGRAEGRRSLLVPAAAMVAPHLDRASAEAARLGLRVEVGSRLTSDLFAGIGTVAHTAHTAQTAQAAAIAPMDSPAGAR